jgi:hypothetical protein
MWDRRVVEKIEECVGEFAVACSFRDVKDGFAWALRGFMGLILRVLGPIGRSWLI